MREFAGMKVPDVLQEKLRPGSSALVVVDLQNDFVHPDGYCARFADVSGFASVLAPNADLIGAARRCDVPVFYTLQTQRSDGRYSSPVWAMETLRYGFDPLHCMEGSWGWQVAEEVAPEERDVLVPKFRRSGFYGTALAGILRGIGIGTVVVTGVAATGCVESTVRGAQEADLFAVVPSDCIGDAVPELVGTAVAAFERLLAPGDVTTAAAVVACWEGGRP